MSELKINPAPETREQLLEANTALWGINLRRHRGDEDFRKRVQQMRQETAELIDAWDAQRQPVEPSEPLST